MDSVEQVKRATNIVDLIGSYLELKKAGRNYKGVCPFHSEKSASFMVSAELQIYKCFGCNKAGDAFSFVQEIEGVDFAEALQKLADRAGIKIEKTHQDPNKAKKSIIFEINHLATELYHYILLKHPLGKDALKYVKEVRKLNDQTIKDFKVGYAPRAWDVLFNALSKKKYSVQDMLAAGVIAQRSNSTGFIDRFYDRVMFPLMDIDGKVLGFTGRTLSGVEPKYLNTSETLAFHKSDYIYALDKARIEIKREGAVFVEGQMDVISCHQAGIKNVIASSGTALTSSQLKILARYSQDLTFCFDNDSAGINAVFRAVDLAEKEKFNLKVAIIPAKYKDIDEYLNADALEATDALKSGVPVYDFFISATVKKYDLSTAHGKRQVVDDLLPLFYKVSDPVTVDYYVKKISGLVGITENVVKDLFAHKKQASEVSFSSTEVQEIAPNSYSKKTLAEYLLALLLKADLDTAQTFVYKLGQRDFIDPALQEIFISLKEYLTGRKRKFEIKYFAERFNGNIKQLVNDLYLWDLEVISDSPEKFYRELSNAFERTKSDTLKRDLKVLTAKIKQAELENNKEALKDLSNKFTELTKKLN